MAEKKRRRATRKTAPGRSAGTVSPTGSGPDLPPGAMTLREYARRRGCVHSTVIRAISAGRLAGSVGYLDDGDPFIAAPDLADKELARTAAPARGSLEEARATRMLAEAELAELELEERGSTLLPTAATNVALTAYCDQVRRWVAEALPALVQEAMPDLGASALQLVRTMLKGAADEVKWEPISPATVRQRRRSGFDAQA